MRVRAVAAALLIGFALPGGAADGAVLAGRVTGAEGAPVPGATVWLYRFHAGRGGRTLEGESTTLPDGAFSVQVPDRAADDPGSYAVYAYCEGLTLGSVLVTDDAAPVEVPLSVPVPVLGMVRNTAGEPIAGAEVSPHNVLIRGSGRRTTGSFVIPDELRERFATTTDETGAFRLTFTAEGAKPSLTIAAQGYGSVVAHTGVDLTQIRLAPAGTIEGRIMGADDPSVFEGLELTATADRRSPGASSAPFSTVRMRVGADGSFLSGEVAPGVYRISFVDAQPATWHVRDLVGVSVESGMEATVEMPAARTVLVRGRVLAADTGQGLPDATLSLSQYDPTTGAGYTTWGLTDAEGRYEIPCLPGTTQLYASSPTYVSGPAASGEVEVGPDGATAPDLTLEPARSLRALVVDEASAPVSGADVSVRQSGPEPGFGGGSAAVTGDDGLCTCPDLVGGPATVQARKGTLVSEDLVVEVGKDGVDEPVRLVLEAGRAAAVTVRIVDQDGRPVAGAQVSLYEQSERYGTSRPVGETDANGQVTQSGLTPGTSYRITASALNAFPVETDLWAAEAGVTHDLGTLTIRLCTGKVSGAVVDENGTPLAGVRVFDPMDAPAVRETRTDADGRFTLGGLGEGPVCVFAESPDRAMACVLAKTGAEGVRIALVPRQPGAVGGPVPSPVVALPEEDAKAKARQVLTAAFADGTWAKWEYQRDELLGLLARVDPAAAYDAAAGANVSTEGITVALGRQAAADDIDEAIALICQAGDPRMMIGNLMEVARRVQDGDPEAATRCLEAALSRAAQLGNPSDRAGHTALVAGQMVRLGDPRGEASLREARDLAEKIGVTGWDAYMRGVVAENLAEVDLEQALALVGTIEEDDERTRHLGNIIRRVAATDPDRAVALMGEIKDQWRRDEICGRAVAFFPMDRLARAVEVARGIGNPVHLGAALARLAWVAPDAQRAALIEEAVDALLSDSQMGGAAYMAARAACAARQLGYPGYGTIAVRALAATGAAADSTEVARALAFVRPDLARYVIERKLLQAGGIGGVQPYVVAGMLRTLATVDPDRAMELLLAWAPPEEQEDYDTRLRVVTDVVKALLDGPAEEERAIITGGNGLIPTDEDD